MTTGANGVATKRRDEEAAVVAGIVVFALLAVAMLAIMLYGVFTEGRRR
jgi:hypothetical membrane protein